MSSILREVLESWPSEDVRWRATLEGLPTKGKKLEVIERILEKDRQAKGAATLPPEEVETDDAADQESLVDELTCATAAQCERD